MFALARVCAVRPGLRTCIVLLVARSLLCALSPFVIAVSLCTSHLARLRPLLSFVEPVWIALHASVHDQRYLFQIAAR